MQGYTVIHLWCACGHTGSVPGRREWEVLLRHQLLAMFKCSACGGRPNDLKIGWMAGLPP